MIKYVAIKIRTVKTFNLQPFTKTEKFFKEKPHMGVRPL